MPKIKFDNVTVTYANGKQNVVALNGLSVEFAPDCFNVVVGASGCGKSTLLRTIAGQLEYDGLVTFDEKDMKRVSEQDRNLAFVSQQYVLYPRMTIFDNIAFPLKAKRMDSDLIVDIVRDIAKSLDLTVCLTRKPNICRVVSNNASHWREHWSNSRKFVCWTSRLATLTPNVV